MLSVNAFRGNARCQHRSQEGPPWGRVRWSSPLCGLGLAGRGPSEDELGGVSSPKRHKLSSSSRSLASKDSTKAFCHGDPRSMKSEPALFNWHQSLTACATNSRPLSTRTETGDPWCSASPSKTLTTRSASMPRFTSIARALRVNSSTRSTSSGRGHHHAPIEHLHAGADDARRQEPSSPTALSEKVSCVGP